MAETAVTLLVDKLQQLLRAEATILGGVHDEVNHIKDELQLINSFLKDADMQAEAESTSYVVKTWVKQMRELAFRMEDVVDYYLLKVVERGQRHGVLGSVTRGKEKIKTLTHRHEIASKISEIKESIKHLNKMRKTMKFKASANTTATPRRYRRLGAHFVEESQLVGINHNRKVLTDWLLTRESKRSVMVVIGPGGIDFTIAETYSRGSVVITYLYRELCKATNYNVHEIEGKTTLVKNVCNRQKKSFGCYAWITVSRVQGDDDMLLIMGIIQSIQKEHPDASAALQIETTDLVSLINTVKNYLGDEVPDCV